MQHAIALPRRTALGAWLATLAAALLAALLLFTTPAIAQVSERVQVADPFLEMRTGPGRGYPVHHVAARGERVTIELRATDWYKVRTDSDTGNDKTGWVHRSQLERTLTEAGVPKSFRDTALDDYLVRRLQFGAAAGRFKSEPMLKLWSSWRLSDTLGVEASVGQVQGTFSGTDFWHVGLTSEPWSDQRLSPFFAIGVGRFDNFPNQTLVGATDTRANLAHAMVGVRYYLSERFVLRADWSLYTAFVSDQRSQEFRAVTAGLSFFFQ
jgi:hypothetical protein